MRILWLVSVTMPDAARALGLTGHIGGGWLQGQLDNCKGLDGLEYTVCAVNPAVKKITQATVNGVDYVVLPSGSEDEFLSVLAAVKPVVAHIWGTEYTAARTLFSVSDPQRTLIGIQGVMTACAAHLLDGVPPALCRSNAAQRFVNSLVPGALLDLEQQKFNALAACERALLANTLHVSGRTAWDKAQLQKLAPHAVYHPCGETLRSEFYTGKWQRRDFGDAPVLFLSQGNYPLKGLHRLLAALPAVKAKYPGLTLRVAGWPPLDKGPLLRPVIDWMFPYNTWLKQLTAQYGLTDCVHYTGPLDAPSMKEAYLNADAFLLTSSIENSPNSLGEAMLLGLPCVAADVGGVPSLAQDGRQALLYPATDTAALSAAILRVLDDAALAAALGAAARARAHVTHDPAANAAALGAIYDTFVEMPYAE